MAIILIPGRRETERSIWRGGLQHTRKPMERTLLLPKNLQHSDLASLEGNIIEVDEPRWWDLADLARTEGIAPIPEVAADLEAHDFWLMQFGLAVAPSDDHQVEWVRLLVKLGNRMGGSAPVVHSMFPARPRPLHGRVGVAADFRFTDGRSGGVPVVAEIDGYEPGTITVTGTGSRTSRPTWDFRDDNVHGYLMSYVVARRLKDSSVQAEFTFSARVRVKGEVVAATTLGGKVYCF